MGRERHRRLKTMLTAETADLSPSSRDCLCLKLYLKAGIVPSELVTSSLGPWH